MTPRPDFCAKCVADQYDTYGRFHGTKNLNPAVTTIDGTRYCGKHAAAKVGHPSASVQQMTGIEIRAVEA